MRTVKVAILVALASSNVAFGQALDAHGLAPTPTDGDSTDPLRVWHVGRSAAGTWSFGGVAELDGPMLVRVDEYLPNACDRENPVDTTGCEVTTLLGGAFGVNLAGSYALSKRVNVTAAVPMWLWSQGDETSAAATGDLRVAVPVALAMDRKLSGNGVGLVPWIELPTGSGAKYLGDGGVSAGVLATGGVAAGVAAFRANLGAGQESWGEGASGGIVGQGGVSAGLVFGDALGIHLETTFQADAGADAPLTSELALSAKGAVGGHFWYTGGIGGGLSRGVGTAESRLWLGIGYRFRPTVLGTEDLTIGRNAVTAVTLTGPNGQPLPGVNVLVDGVPAGTTDANGQLSLPAASFRKDVTATAPGYLPVEITADGEVAAAQLAYAPAELSFAVRDQNGRPLAGTVSVVGNSVAPATLTEGVAQLALAPGEWQVVVDSPGMGRQVRTLVIEPFAAPVDTEVVLAAADGEGRLLVSVTDTEEMPLSARLLLDGKPVGSTGPWGTLDLGNLSASSHRIEASADGFRTLEVRDVNVDPSKPAEVRFRLDRLPGSVRVLAHGPSGQQVDAVVRFDGPYEADGTPSADAVRLAPQSLGAVGERIFVLRPGRWHVFVASKEYGVQQREVWIPAEETRLTVVDVILQPSEDGEGDLMVRVVDPDGQPIDGAEVSLDGNAVGTTSSGGSVELSSLDPGSRQLVVKAARFRPTEPQNVIVTDGRSERTVTLSWLPGTVRVLAKSPLGPVPDATARFAGVAPMSPLPLGEDGQEYTTLAAGKWSVIVASARYGLQQREVVVPEDSTNVIPVEVTLNPAEGGLSDLTVRVVGPDGQPVPNAAIKLDGTALGATSTGGAVSISELDPGPRKLVVTADPYLAKTQALTLKDGSQVVNVQLDWALGATKIVVQAADGGTYHRVSDAVVRLAGPSVLAARPVDASGERLFLLAPGRWTAVVVSPENGMSQQEFVVDAKVKGLQTVNLDLSALGQGEAAMLVRVQDPDGKVIPGATVRIGGQSKGTTSGAGSLLIGGLAAGQVALEASAPGYITANDATATVGEGAQERIVTLAFVPTPVQVQVQDSAGAAVNAELRFQGPASIDNVAAGATGRRSIELRPGKWQIVAVDPTLGSVSQEIVVRPGDANATVKLVLKAKKVDMGAGENIHILDQVQFDFDSATLRPESASILDEVAATILANPSIAKVEIQGHADDVGSVEVNFQLSRARAEAVVKALESRGVAPERLSAQGYGATRPLVPNADDAARAQNRRVQFEIVE